MMLIWPRFMLRKNVRALIEPPTYTQADLDAAVRAEREACAKVAARQVGDWSYITPGARAWHAENVAAVIRERGK